MFVRSALKVFMLPLGLATSASASDTFSAADVLADLMIRMVEIELSLEAKGLATVPPKASTGNVEDTLDQRLTRLEALDPGKREVEPVQPRPVKLGYQPATQNGSIIASANPSRIDEQTIARMPTSLECADLGGWFLSLDMKRDYTAFFVRNGLLLRVCQKSSNGWKSVRPQGDDPAHLVFRIN